MRRLRSRKSIALFCIGVVAFAGFVSLVDTAFAAILTPLWLVLPAAVVVLLRRAASGRPERPVRFLPPALPRPPPAVSPLA
jgi:O-antigen ligase